jgi:hypothetical protein
MSGYPYDRLRHLQPLVSHSFPLTGENSASAGHRIIACGDSSVQCVDAKGTASTCLVVACPTSPLWVSNPEPVFASRELATTAPKS